jgi:hypothetical protein
LVTSSIGNSLTSPEEKLTHTQMMLIGTKDDPHATEQMDIAIANFIFSNGLPISLVECAKFCKLIQSARHIPPKYTPPYRKKTGRTIAG